MGVLGRPSATLLKGASCIRTQIRLLSRAMKLLVQPGQSLFGTLVLENLRKGPARRIGRV